MKSRCFMRCVRTAVYACAEVKWMGICRVDMFTLLCERPGMFVEDYK